MSPLEEYLAVIRAPATRVVYKHCLKRIHPDPNELLNMAQKDRKELEKLVFQFILKERDRVSPTHTRQPIIALRGFLNFHDVELKWGKIRAAMPKARFVARDRAPKLTEIRELLQFADPRMRMIILILASSGIRLGGFEGLKLGSLVNLDNGHTIIGRITTYPCNDPGSLESISFEMGHNMIRPDGLIVCYQEYIWGSSQNLFVNNCQVRIARIRDLFCDMKVTPELPYGIR